MLTVKYKLGSRDFRESLSVQKCHLARFSLLTQWSTWSPYWDWIKICSERRHRQGPWHDQLRSTVVIHTKFLQLLAIGLWSINVHQWRDINITFWFDRNPFLPSQLTTAKIITVITPKHFNATQKAKPPSKPPISTTKFYSVSQNELHGSRIKRSRGDFYLPPEYVLEICLRKELLARDGES